MSGFRSRVADRQVTVIQGGAASATATVYNLTLNSTGTGASTFTLARVRALSLTSTGTGTSAFGLKARRAVAFTSTGTGASTFGLNRLRPLTLASTGTGTSAFALTAKRRLTLASTGTGTSAFTLGRVRALAFTSTGAGTSAFGLKAKRAFAFASTGASTSAFALNRLRNLAFSSTGTGASTFTLTAIVGGVVKQVTFSSTGSGTSAFTLKAKRALSFSSTGSGTSLFTLARKRAFAFASTGSGTSAFAVNRRRNLTFTSTGSGRSYFFPRTPWVVLGVAGQSSPALADFTSFNTKIAPRTIEQMLLMQDLDTEPLYYSAYNTWATSLSADLLPTLSPSVHKLNDFVAGTFDTTGLNSGGLAGLAADAVAFGRPMYIRLAHEFNITSAVYGKGAETAAQFVAGWQKIVNVFRANGATNVKWIWCPNIWSLTAGAIADPTVDDGSGSNWYPGDAYVDVIALDGYESTTNGSCYSPAQLFLADYTTLTTAIPNKPFAIGEFGVTAEARLSAWGGKSGWYDLFFTMIRNDMPRCILVNQWERAAGAEDWTIGSSGTDATAQAHFVTGVNTPVFAAGNIKQLTLTSTGTGTSTFTLRAKRALSLTSTGSGASTFTLVRKRALALTSTGTGTSSFTLVRKRALTLSSTGSGTSTFALTAKRALTFTSTGSGTSTFALTSITAGGTLKQLYWDEHGGFYLPGDNVLPGDIGYPGAYTGGIGTDVFTLRAKRSLAFSSSGTGTSAFSLRAKRALTLTSTGSGTSSFTLRSKHAFLLTSTGVGTSTFAVSAKRALTLASTGTGTTLFTVHARRALAFNSTGLGLTTFILTRILPTVTTPSTIESHTGGGGEWVIWGKPVFPGNDEGAWRRFPKPNFRKPTRSSR